jgi:ABC-type multidrug transport system ATPase subunit
MTERVRVTEPSMPTAPPGLGAVVLSIERLSVRRGGRTIIEDVELEARAGEIVGVVGKNGCGKTTLLGCVAGVLPPRDGRAVIDGASVWGTRAERQRSRRALGYVPEAADPPGFLLGNELWSLCAATRGANPPSAQLRAALGLDELRDTALERMSLGQRRRACLGAAFIGPPKLLVLDEPDNGLDAKRLDAIGGLIRDHATSGGATILASHDAALLEQLGARIYAMPDRGQDPQEG